ncbi:hypothetical protein DFH11DRAFT_1192993 [Phellopilus nigrolimitatus]|nr:hypothetical protein DFH11DRAFT_1192993 [Phellopilus nigrolimitatus]
MVHRTPWAHSSVPSDRIKPHSRPSTPAKNKGKANDTSAPVQHAPKSAAVRALESTIADLTSSSGRERDAQGGCFCQARTHELARHTPLCAHCGLVLCALNPPHLACPHCATPLLSPSAHTALLESLGSELAAVLAREETDAQRKGEEAREAAGAFPQLLPGDARGGGPKLASPTAPKANQAHRVLSLNAKTKRVTVASYTPPRPPAPTTSSNSGAGGEDSMTADDPPPVRVPPPACAVLHARDRPNATRPWADVRGDGFVRTLTYVREPRIDREEVKEGRKTRKAKKARDRAEGNAAAAAAAAAAD